MELTTSQVLDRAADLIEEHGWGKGVMSMFGDGGLCIMGALFAAQTGAFASGDDGDADDHAYDTVERCPAGLAVSAHLAAVLTPDDMELWRWNDARVEASEVIEVLRAAALIEAARENAETREPVSA